MPKSRNRKNHKQKVAARRERINHEKARLKKKQMEWINSLIEREKQMGLFDNNQPVDSVLDGPIIDTTFLEGPSI